jgi:hypothetical protein
MDIVLGAIVLSILVALYLLMIVVAHHARMAGSAPVAPLAADDRTRAVWQSGG